MISDRLRQIFEYIAPKNNITIEEWDHDVDHVHILFRSHPNTELSKFINAYKSDSSRLIKKEFTGNQEIVVERNVLVAELLPDIHRESRIWDSSSLLILTGAQ